MNNKLTDINYNPYVGATLDPNGSFTQYGISLFEHYAGLAMQGLISHYGLRESHETLSKESFKIAHEMLKQRSDI